MGTEVAIIASFAISVLLSNFGFAACDGSFLRSTLLGVFGVMGIWCHSFIYGDLFYLQTEATRAVRWWWRLARCFGRPSQLLMEASASDWNLGIATQAGGGGFIGGILMLLLCGTGNDRSSSDSVGAGTRCCVHYGVALVNSR